MPNQTLLDILTKQGCVIEIDHSLKFIPAQMKLTDSELLWVNIFPETQHDMHSFEYKSVKVHWNRDVELTSSGEEGVGVYAYVAPFDEWYYPDLADLRELHSRWQVEIDSERFARFTKGFFS